MRFDLVELAGLDQRSDECPSRTAVIRTCKQSVFSVQCNWPDAALDGVVINLDFTIIEEPREPCTPLDAITNDLGNAAFLRQKRQLL